MTDADKVTENHHLLEHVRAQIKLKRADFTLVSVLVDSGALAQS